MLLASIDFGNIVLKAPENIILEPQQGNGTASLLWLQKDMLLSARQSVAEAMPLCAPVLTLSHTVCSAAWLHKWCNHLQGLLRSRSTAAWM